VLQFGLNNLAGIGQSGPMNRAMLRQHPW
jgi:hypothetical protein